MRFRLNKKHIVVLGTSRSDGNTKASVSRLSPFSDFELIDLNDYKIYPYNYECHYPKDDQYLEIAKRMSEADQIAFATPVYWYSMSSALKALFDRFTDLISSHKQLGRSLKGKKTFLIATGSDLTLPNGFEEPFKLTSEYFEMSYQGAIYQCVK
jgi:multimeric flavodoxin WrbA